MSCSREHYVNTAKTFIGYSEDNGKFREIIDIYNNGLSAAIARWGTRNYRMPYDGHWCSCFVSAAAMKAGCADIVPVEVSCYYHRVIAQRNNIYKPKSYTPKPGDLVIFDWDGAGGEDHIGIISNVDNLYIYTIEGNTGGHGSGVNYMGEVKAKQYSRDSQYITCYIAPTGWSDETTQKIDEPQPITSDKVNEIAREVIAGKWGNGKERFDRLTDAGYNYYTVQAVVNNLLSGTPEDPVKDEPEYYTVQTGDTLWSIAKRYNIPLADLIEINKTTIKNPNLIYKGQRVRIK